MVDRKILPKNVKVGGPIFEELAFEYIEKKYNISKEDLLNLSKKKKDISNTIPLSILKTSKLSSLEAIVKFLRENKLLSYALIASNLHRNPKTLAVTYAVARRKMPESFSKEYESDIDRIPFSTFRSNLSILESICTYLKSAGNSYAEISRMINKDQRTVWTVCKRAEYKLNKEENGR